MDILTVILAGRGGGKKPKNILRGGYQTRDVTCLVYGGVLHLPVLQMTSYGIERIHYGRLAIQVLQP